MDLHSIAAGAIGTVNPFIQVTLRINVGSTVARNGVRTPAYATPGNITASIDGTLLTVESLSAGVLQSGQVLTGSGVSAGTTITDRVTGTGGVGTYRVSPSQITGTVGMTTALLVRAQIQPVTWRDLQQMDGLNVQGIRWKAYLHGEVNGVVRPERKGGDLITIAMGRHQGEWLVAQVLEQWPDWVCAAITLQGE